MPDGRRLRIAPQATPPQGGVVVRVTPQEAGWQALGFEVRRLGPGGCWVQDTGACEAVLVWLSGRATVRSNRGSWERVGRRRSPFHGMPYALYLPPATEFEVVADSEGVELACGWAPAEGRYPPRLVTPADVGIEIRGGWNATRQINGILPPGFPCERLVCVEVYTPGGNWSSYPPHKHDVHRVDQWGHLVEAALEEVYFYKFQPPEGFALQRIYAHDGSFDVAVVARQDDLVLVPCGYHPVSAAYGYTCYYLNVLAGSAQSLANSEDPAHTWVRSTWTERDPRVPVVTHAMETGDG
ncbi:MAG: 5-deoxy-glucuronate isomerase [candidate division GAL15 bacterium]